MLPPKTIDLGEGSIDINALKNISKRNYSPVPSNWTRVQFQIPIHFEALGKIREWLDEQVVGRYHLYRYTHPRTQTEPDTVVVLFETRNDALMFKLKDGFRAWLKNTNE